MVVRRADYCLLSIEKDDKCVRCYLEHHGNNVTPSLSLAVQDKTADSLF